MILFAKSMTKVEEETIIFVQYIEEFVKFGVR